MSKTTDKSLVERINLRIEEMEKAYPLHYATRTDYKLLKDCLIGLQ